MEFFSVTIDLTAEDVAMLRRVAELTEIKGGWPKRRAVVRVEGESREHEKRNQYTFERLKMLGLVRHNMIGECWLSELARGLKL